MCLRGHYTDCSHLLSPSEATECSFSRLKILPKAAFRDGVRLEVRLDSILARHRGNDRHNFAYSRDARKDRCVGRSRNIACIINELYWSGRRDSNPRPSAPKTDPSFHAKSLINKGSQGL